jgi:hypothetical protein
MDYRKRTIFNEELDESLNRYLNDFSVKVKTDVNIDNVFHGSMRHPGQWATTTKFRSDFL